MGQLQQTFNYRGSKLVEIVDNANNVSISFDYDYNGRRTKKLNSSNSVTSKYFYDGDLLVKEIRGNSILNYLYDGNNSLIGFEYFPTENSTKQEYFFLKNSLNDIVEILDKDGNSLVHYVYGAFGEEIEVVDNSSNNLSQINSFRYRGYYYDNETQFYWVSSRYYSPELCRWISPDSIEYLESDKISGLNLYTYCFNNPVMYVDPTGHFALSSIVIGALIGFITTAIKDIQYDGKFFNGDIKRNDYIGSIIGGAIGGVGKSFAAIFLANGIGNVVEESFKGNISSYKDLAKKFAIGGFLGAIGYGISKAMTGLFANKEIFESLGSLSDSIRMSNNFSKLGSRWLKSGINNLDEAYKELYNAYGYGMLEEIISKAYDFSINLVF